MSAPHHFDVGDFILQIRRTCCDKSKPLIKAFQIFLGGNCNSSIGPQVFALLNCKVHEFLAIAFAATGSVSNHSAYGSGPIFGVW